MASASRTIEIIFAGVDNLSSSLTTMGGNVEDFGQSLQDFGAPFADATKIVLALDAAIAGLAIAGITASSEIESETSKMTASLGLTNEEAEKFKDIATDVYSGGFGEDLVGAFDAVTLAQKKLGDNAEIDIGKVTTQALGLQKTFGADVSDSLGAVDTLMNNFGLSTEEAFDFVSAGYQKGLDGSGDFLQSISEFSTQFKNGGANAGQFFSIMETGYQDGYLGADKAADAFKEFRVRIQDGSKTTKEALESIGIDPVAFEANMASGKLAAIDAFDIVQQKLNETDNISTQFSAGVGLMGSQFEDLGTKSALGLSTTKTSLSDLTGTMDSVSKASETFEKTMTAAFRTITTEFGSMSQWEDAKNAIGAVFADVAAQFGPALKKVDFSGLEDAVGDVWDKISDVFIDNDFDLKSVEGMENAIDFVVESIDSLVTITGGIVDAFVPMIAGVTDAVKWFNSLDSGSKTLVGNILGLGTGLTALGGIISVGGSLLSGLGALVGFFAPTGLLITGVAALAAFLVKDSVDAFASAGQALKDYEDTMLDWKDLLDELPEQKKVAIEAALDSGDFEEADKLIKDLTEEDWKIAINADADTDGTLDAFKEALEDLPAETKAKILAEVEKGDFETVSKLIDDITNEEHKAKIIAEIKDAGLVDFEIQLNDISGETEAQITAAINKGDFETVEKLLNGLIKDPLNVDVEPKVDEPALKGVVSILDKELSLKAGYEVWVSVETKGVDGAKKEIEEIPTEKMLEIKLQGEIDKEIETIKTQAETVQTAMEWTAKVDIAQAESAAKQVVSAFEASADSIEALSSSVSDMFGSYLSNIDKLSGADKWDAQDMLEEQQDAQNKLIDSQIELTAAQKEYIDAKTDAIKNGDGQIKIDGTGLSPALEMVMWEILELVQVRATAEQSDFLLGM